MEIFLFPRVKAAYLSRVHRINEWFVVEKLVASAGEKFPPPKFVGVQLPRE